jgi:hypothetical protein
MSTLVDQARMRAEDFRYGAVEFSASQATGIFHLLRQLADRVQELEGKGEPVVWRHWHGEDNGGWEYYEEASCADCQPLYASPPSSVQPEKEERRPSSPIECVPPKGMNSINWRLAYRQGWEDAERAHGISPSPSMVGREDTTHG